MMSDEADEARPEPYRAKAGETVVPAFQKSAFHCPYCHVYAEQSWLQTRSPGTTTTPLLPIWQCRCRNCNERSWWLTFLGGQAPQMLYPPATVAPPPHPDMPDDSAAEYREAASIILVSPRGAGALLRLALQKLMVDLGEKGNDLNAAIGSLVKKGLDPDVQKALDGLRVIGNNAVHPLELDLTDDVETVGALFGLLNFIVEDRIARPKKLDDLYSQLPDGARKAIQERDAEKSAPPSPGSA